MDPESPQQPSAQPDTNKAASHHTDLWRDPPPRPPYKTDTPEQDAAVERDLLAWNTRNADYVRSWDPHSLCQLPLLSRLWGYDGAWFHYSMCHDVLFRTSLAGRRLSPTELNLLCMYLSRGTVAASYDRPVTIGVTAFFLWRGAATFRMPFYQPRFVRFTHPQLARRPLLSTMAWHATRTGAYGALAYTAYYFLAPRYRKYIQDEFVGECMLHELGMKTLADDMGNNLDRLNREQTTKRRLNGQDE